jgi:hypothetical protein
MAGAGTTKVRNTWKSLVLVQPFSPIEADENTEARAETAHQVSTPTTTLTVAMPFLSTSSSDWVGRESLAHSSIAGGDPYRLLLWAMALTSARERVSSSEALLGVRHANKAPRKTRKTQKRKKATGANLEALPPTNARNLA